MSFQRFQREVALRLALFLCVLCLLWAGLACKDEPVQPPPPPLTEITLNLEDAGVTDAWLRLSFPDSTDVRTIALQRDGRTVQTFHVTTKDTLLVDEGLEPSRTYRYQAVRLIDGKEREKSNELQFTTMGVTSSAFQWTLDTLGDGASSVLYDVAIVNDTLVYAVGEIYMKGENRLYNLAVWRGQEWELKRVTVVFRGNPVTVPLEGIFAHSATDIWVAGSIPIHGDGENWIGYDIQTLVGIGATVSRIWGTPTQMYFVGREGNIIMYDGNRWRKLSSGTTLTVRDIYGALDKKTGKLEILAVAGDPGVSVERKILGIDDKYFRVTEISDSGINWSLSSVWFIPHRMYYVVGSGIYEKYLLTDKSWNNEPTQITKYYTHFIRGNSLNDIIAVGSYGDCLHFNGVKWNIQRLNTALTNGEYVSVRTSSSLIVAVGYQSQHAIVLIGKR